MDAGFRRHDSQKSRHVTLAMAKRLWRRQKNVLIAPITLWDSSIS